MPNQITRPVNLLILLLLFAANFSFAQTSAPLPILCGNEVFDHILKNRYPELRQAFQSSFDENLNHPPAAGDRSPKTIRVVVHVVWNSPEENLADSVILNQIAVLNEDYNRQNADTANLRPAFLPVAGNPQITFELAEIKRVQTSALFELDLFGSSIFANLKTSSEGGSDARDPDKYLNIWICKIQPISFGGITIGQVLGLAFPPNNLANWPPDTGAPAPEQDGVVLDYRIIGRNNPNTIAVPGGAGNLVVRGRTATHEVGHYLGLRHIWGDGGVLGQPNDCNQSDGIDDTPFANAQSAFDCDITRNTCSKIEPFYSADMPDLIENYMDYSSEACMNMFTQGQANLMQNVLDGPRKNLVQTSSSPSPVSDAAMPVLFPNPARAGRTVLSLPAGWQSAAIDLVGPDGRMIRRLPVSDFSGKSEQQIAFDTHNLSPGWYAVRVLTTDRVWVERLIVH